MNKELRTPEALSTQIEDESICEKLLGWKPVANGWIKQDGFMYGGCGTPTFTTWAEAGLILEKLDCFDIYHTNQYWTLAISAPRPQGMTQTMPRPFEGHSEISGPLAIRAAAIAYIRSRP